MHAFLVVLFLSDTKVYAALGNHDFHPKNQFPAESNSIYNQMAELWRPWFNNESFAVFKEGINDACYHMGANCMSGGVWSNFVFKTSPEIDTDFCPHFTEEETETEVTQFGKGVENRDAGQIPRAKATNQSSKGDREPASARHYPQHPAGAS